MSAPEPNTLETACLKKSLRKLVELVEAQTRQVDLPSHREWVGGWETAYTRMYVNKMLLCQCAHTTHKRPKNHCDGNVFIPLLYTPSLPDVYAKQMVGCMPLSHSTSTETTITVLCDLDAPHTCRSKGVFGMFPAQPCPALMASTAK